LSGGFFPTRRRLWVEPLEDRRLLSISPWRAVDRFPASCFTQASYLRATDFDTYTLDTQQLRASLTGAGQAEFVLPNPDGGLDRFAGVEAPMMAAELAALFCR
jgi:hypothetical protein